MNHYHHTTGQRRTNLGQQGLTLLEVLLALLMLAVMGVIALEAFRLGHRSWERGEQRAEAEQRIRVIHGMLADALASLQPVRAEVDGKRVMAFRGSRDRVFFYSAPDRYLAFPYAGMVRGLSFFVEQGKGLVVEESYPLVEGQVSLDPRGAIKVVDPHVTGIRFRYLVPPSEEENGPRWVETWEPLELSEGTVRSARVPPRRHRRRTASRSAQHRLLPLAVEARVTVADKRGEREHNSLFPIRVGHYVF